MARAKIDPMTKSNKKPITIQKLDSEAVITTHLLTEFMSLHGGNLLDAGLRFGDAHMELRIILKADNERGIGWVTAEEADQITAHMEARAGDAAPSAMKWL